MKTYQRNFKKTVWGYATVTAKHTREAKNKFDTQDTDDEYDNKSEYEWEEKIIEVKK